MGGDQTLNIASVALGSHRVPYEKSSHHKRPDQQRDQLVPREKAVITPPVGNESSPSQHRVLTDKGKIPDRMKDIEVNCGLRDVEQTHRNERGIIACPVSFKATLVFFFF